MKDNYIRKFSASKTVEFCLQLTVHNIYNNVHNEIKIPPSESYINIIINNIALSRFVGRVKDVSVGVLYFNISNLNCYCKTVCLADLSSFSSFMDYLNRLSSDVELI